VEHAVDYAEIAEVGAGLKRRRPADATARAFADSLVGAAAAAGSRGAAAAASPASARAPRVQALRAHEAPQLQALRARGRNDPEALPHTHKSNGFK